MEATMARTPFYYHEKGNHDERWYYLCRDDNGKAYIESEFSPGPGRGNEDIGPTSMSVLDFLASGQGTAQDKLLQLIASIIPENAADAQGA
jgi:hypothetical protein